MTVSMWCLCVSTRELWSLLSVGLIPFSSIGFFSIVFTNFELGLQALCLAFERLLPWLSVSWELFILNELFFPSIHAKADRKSCFLEHGKFQEEKPCFAKAQSVVQMSTLTPTILAYCSDSRCQLTVSKCKLTMRSTGYQDCYKLTKSNNRVKRWV